jgi:hypothetical protein
MVQFSVPDARVGNRFGDLFRLFAIVELPFHQGAEGCPPTAAAIKIGKKYPRDSDFRRGMTKTGPAVAPKSAQRTTLARVAAGLVLSINPMITRLPPYS